MLLTKNSHAFFVFFIISTFSPSVLAESLSEVYQQAKTQGVQVKVSEAGYLAALEKIPQVHSCLRPRVNLYHDQKF